MKNRTRNRPQIDQTLIKYPPKIGSGADWASETVFGSIFVQFWLQLGTVLGAKLGPSWAHVGQKIDFWRFPKACKNDNDFQHLSEPSWDRFWNDFGAQNRTKIGPRSVSRAIMKERKRSSKSSAGAVFLEIRGLEHRSKFDQNRV